jgi:DNA-binding transcriptional regulator YiaG
MISEEYKAIREKLGLTQGGLAARLGVTLKRR